MTGGFFLVYNMAMEKNIRVGIIGTGRHGSRYANHLVNDLPGRFTLAGICRRGAIGRQQAREWGATYYEDWKELVAANNIDAIISATPPHINYDIMELCAKNEKPLLIEKPLTTDYRTALSAVRMFSEKNVPLTVGQTLRYNSVILALQKKIGAMGKIYNFSATQRLEPSSHGWLNIPEVAGSGVIFHTAIHMFDAIRFITGAEVVRIRATARKIYNPHLEDLLCAELELSNGAIGLVDTSKLSPSRSARYEFVCEKGQLQGDQIHGKLQKIDGMEIRDLQVQPPGPAILPLLQDWHLFLTQGGDNPIPAEAGLSAVKICHACRASVESGNWVKLKDAVEPKAS